MFEVTFKGNVGKDVEIKKNDGVKFGILTVAVSTDYRADGVWINQPPLWKTVILSEKQLEYHQDKLKKGNRLLISGKETLRVREKNDKTYNNWFVDPSTIDRLHVNKGQSKGLETPATHFTADDIPF
ncbi:MAG: single-stranded DNA-binding protein [Crocinitomicaceae bacterium]|nr:single-stranded DNA-binding protein [Crocinitomicaceae bacterium]